MEEMEEMAGASCHVCSGTGRIQYKGGFGGGFCTWCDGNGEHWGPYPGPPPSRCMACAGTSHQGESPNLPGWRCARCRGTLVDPGVMDKPHPPQLLILIGAPGSGRGELAAAWCADAWPTFRARMSLRDTWRSVSGGTGWVGSPHESTRARVAWTAYTAATRGLLGKGMSVVASDLGDRTESHVLSQLAQLGEDVGAEVILHAMETPLEVCLERNAARPEEDQAPAHLVESVHKAQDKVMDYARRHLAELALSMGD